MSENRTARNTPLANGIDAAADHAANKEVVDRGNAARTRLSRRGFLRAAGFAVPALGLAGCGRAPVEKAVPYLTQPETIVPGESVWYASTCAGCEAACGTLIKNRDGRPIKLEGNREHPLSRGGLCPRGQAAVLELYDSKRLGQPLRAGEPTSWWEVDRDITTRLAAARAAGKRVRLLTGTIVSPTLQRMIDTFLHGFPHARHVCYDAVSRSAILDAHEKTHGTRVLPHFRFDQAAVIVGIDADFLGTWIAPVEFTMDWQQRRRPQPDAATMSFHTQIESRLSITGSKADQRWAVRPSQLRQVVAELTAAVARRAGNGNADTEIGAGPVEHAEIERLGSRLWAARNRSLVVCGVNDLDLQLACHNLNQLLGAYGTTIDLKRPSRQAAGNDRQLVQLLDELRRKQVDALLVLGVNPAYDLAAEKEIEQLLATPLLISFASHLDETARLAQFVCPDHHVLESWGDASPVAGVVSLTQPAIAPLGQTRSALETLAIWSGKPASALDLVRETWQRDVYPAGKSDVDFQTFWDRALERGVAEIPVAAGKTPTATMPKPSAASVAALPSDASALELVLYPSVAMADGRHAHNPWLHELPDPITKCTWDNVAALSPANAARLGVVQGDLVRLTLQRSAGADRTVELPAFVQPGQAEGSVAVAIGYGRAGTDRFTTLGPAWIGAPRRSDPALPVGASVAPLITDGRQGGHRRYQGAWVKIERLGQRRPLALTQTQHSLDVPTRLAFRGVALRDVIHTMDLGTLASADAPPHPAEPTLWPDDHPYTGHHWGLVVDLNACTGCSACVVACRAENNIPVVGKDEVRRRRDMYWLRIDTYYASATRHLNVVHQPMMCQQCDNAPCETVCPVLATVHSSEGLNEQVYNRCVGTRYCENNCPYKVRRFNWFNYHPTASREDLVLNPDVTVRSRGVMEKCTFCVQRIAAAKISAKGKGVALRDGAIETACQQSCPAAAIVFGDLNDPKSRVAQLMASPRRYHALEELGVLPSVGYLAVVRHDQNKEGNVAHG